MAFCHFSVFYVADSAIEGMNGAEYFFDDVSTPVPNNKNDICMNTASFDANKS